MRNGTKSHGTVTLNNVQSKNMTHTQGVNPTSAPQIVKSLALYCSFPLLICYLPALLPSQPTKTNPLIILYTGALGEFLTHSSDIIVNSFKGMLDLNTSFT